MKRNFDNKTLDRIGKKLVRSSGVPASELDRIVANTDLFSLINKRIGEVTPQPTSRPAFTSFVRQYATAIAGGAILVIVGVGVASLLRPEKAPSVASDLRVPAAKSSDVVVAPPVIPPQGTIDSKLSADGDDDDEFRVENAIHTPRRNQRRRAIEPVSDTGDGDFHPITYTGDTLDTAAGGRIIRVELKRSSLFALGVNLPLENDDDEMVKADLLVGKDGVTRGVRVVN